MHIHDWSLGDFKSSTCASKTGAPTFNDFSQFEIFCMNHSLKKNEKPPKK